MTQMMMKMVVVTLARIVSIQATAELEAAVEGMLGAVAARPVRR